MDNQIIIDSQMAHIEFANKMKVTLEAYNDVVGLAVAGSWLTDELDDFSDLDLILVTQHKVGGTKEKMLEYARRIPHFLSGFTGEHVGEPRLLICLYGEPLLHVDIKFVTIEEFGDRIETPVLLLDKNGELRKVVERTQPKFPYPDYQWIEDRFWIWVHYALLKIGRGEYVEAYDFLGFLRMTVLGPLLHIKNGSLPRGVRKVESKLSASDFDQLRATLPAYAKDSLFDSLINAVALYRRLRSELFSVEVLLQKGTEEKVMIYFQQLKSQT
jgi:hypothetical protein